MFAVVRDQDGRAKRHVQAITRQRGRGPETKVRVVSDGEDGMRSIAGKWFNANEQHILDWYHIARRFEAIGKASSIFLMSRISNTGFLANPQVSLVPPLRSRSRLKNHGAVAFLDVPSGSRGIRGG